MGSGIHKEDCADSLYCYERSKKLKIKSKFYFSKGTREGLNHSQEIHGLHFQKTKTSGVTDNFRNLLAACTSMGMEESAWS